MPFKYENISKGASVGIVGIGGIGHLAVCIL
jgi:D-arabinose 1-dehydrogenase-like Zn-dependent alcohol dehydrogenase